MIQDILTVTEFGVSSLKLTHFVGLMTYTRDQCKIAFSQGLPIPSRVAEQWERFQNAYNNLDSAYKADSYSLFTPDLKAADLACDKIFMGMKKMVQAQQAFDFNPTVKQAADRVMQAIDKFGITTSEDYLGQNNKLHQLDDEITHSDTLSADAETLGISSALTQLRSQVALVRSLLTKRGMAKPAKGAMQAARNAIEPEYRWFITILNAAALIDDDEHRFEALFQALNQNIDYLKNTVLARQTIEEESAEEQESESL